MGKWKEHSVSQLPAHSPDWVCTSKAALILSVFVFFFSETKRFSTINDNGDTFKRSIQMKQKRKEKKTVQKHCHRLAHALDDGSGRRCTSGCAPRAYLTTKWNGNIGMCVALFSASFFHSCAAFQLNILTSLTFPTETVVPVAERHFPILSSLLMHMQPWLQYIFLFEFAFIHSLLVSILCIFTC